MSRCRLAYSTMLLFLTVTLISGPLVACQTPAPPAIATPSAATPQAALTPVGQPATGVPISSYNGPLAPDQVLRLDIALEPVTLDPNMAEDTTSTSVLSPMYEGLTRFRPDLTVEPAIAQSWDFAPDGKAVTFKLRDSKWSDGSAVTAKDFEYSWKRLLNPQTASAFASILTQDVVGADAFNSTAVPTDTAKLPEREAALGIKAVDDKTFQVSLNAPATYFLAVTALANVVPLQRAAVEKGGAKWTEPPNHVSNGPFVLKSWQHQSSITLEPNPNYWDKKPTLTRIAIAIRAEEKASEEAYKNNELDMSRVPAADIGALRADPKLGKEILQGSLLANTYIGFNMNKEPFIGEKGKLVRQAFSQAIDRQSLVDVVEKGVQISATSFIPPGLFGYQSDIGFKFDPAKAKATLQKAGYADAKALGKITLLYNSPPPANKARFEFVADQLSKNLGVDIDLQSLEPAATLALLKKDPPQMFRWGWNADYPHPNDFLNVVFSSKSAQNYGRYNNPQFDKLVQDAAREGDQAKQLQLYNQAQQILVDDAPAIFLYYSGRFRLIKPYVKDLFPTPQDQDIPGVYFLRLTKIAQH